MDAVCAEIDPHAIEPHTVRSHFVVIRLLSFATIQCQPAALEGPVSRLPEIQGRCGMAWRVAMPTAWLPGHSQLWMQDSVSRKHSSAQCSDRYVTGLIKTWFVSWLLFFFFFYPIFLLFSLFLPNFSKFFLLKRGNVVRCHFFFQPTMYLLSSLSLSIFLLFIMLISYLSSRLLFSFSTSSSLSSSYMYLSLFWNWS